MIIRPYLSLLLSLLYSQTRACVPSPPSGYDFCCQPTSPLIRS